MKNENIIGIHIENCVAVGKKWSWLRIFFSIPFVYRICLHFGYKAKAKILSTGWASVDEDQILHLHQWVVQPPWKMGGFQLDEDASVWGYTPEELVALSL